MYDAATLEFCELVDCDPSEVRDADPELIATAFERAAETNTPAAKNARFGTREMPYGKHKGTTIDNVPRDYLEWLAHSPNGPQATNASRKFKLQIKAYLKTRQG